MVGMVESRDRQTSVLQIGNGTSTYDFALASKDQVREMRHTRAWERAMTSAQEAMREPFEVKVDFMLGCGLYEAPGGGGYWTSDGWATDGAGIVRTYGPHATLEAPPYDGTTRGWIVQFGGYVYLLRGRYAAKYIPNDQLGVEWPIVALHDFHDGVTDGTEPYVIGRPAIFKDKLYVPMADAADSGGLVEWAVLTAQNAPTTTTAALSPSAATSSNELGGTRAWASPSSALASDDAWASASGAGTSELLRLTNFNPGLSAAAQVRGIKVTVERRASGTGPVPQFVTSTSGVRSGAGSISFTRPTVQAGDLMLIQLMVYQENGLYSVSGPSGWTSTAVTNVGSRYQTRWYRKIATASEPSQYTISNAYTASFYVQFIVIRGVHPTAPFNQTNNAELENGGSNSWETAGITTSANNCLLLFGTSVSENVGDVVDSYSAGYTERAGVDLLASELKSTYLSIATAEQAVAGASGSPTVTLTGTHGAGQTVLFAIQPGGATTVDERISLIAADGTLGSQSNKAASGSWPASDATVTYGSTTDTWSLTLTGADVNDADFGVGIAITNSLDADVAQIDHVTMEITYYVEHVDTWARGPSGPTFARCFVTWRDRLVRGIDDAVSLASDDPADPANWGPEYTVGGSGRDVTDLTTYASYLMAAKPDGLYSFDENTIAENELPDLEAVVYDDNFIGLEPAQGAIFAPHAIGLVRWRPGGFVIIGDEQDGLSETGGYTHGIARYGKQIYFVKGSGHFGVLVPGQGRASPYIPHMLKQEDATFESVRIITSDEGIAYALTLAVDDEAYTMRAYRLPRFGQPNSRDSDVPRTPDGTATIVTPYYRHIDSTVRRVWQHVMVDVEDIDGTLDVEADLEDTTIELDSISTAGVHRLPFPSMTAGPTRLRFSATAATSLRDIRLRGVHVTISDEQVSGVFIVRTGTLSDGSFPQESVEERLSFLRSLTRTPDLSVSATAEPVRLRDPDTGDVLRVVIQELHEADWDAPSDREPQKVVAFKGLVVARG